MKLVVFAYNFPHRKTHDFIYELVSKGYDIQAVIAADAVKLSIPPCEVRTKIRMRSAPHPRETAKLFRIPYLSIPHSGSEVEQALIELSPDVGVIGGARILKKGVIQKFKVGVLNFHPGLIPDARGLDALLWSIRDGLPLGVTAHLIDERVDAGRIIERRTIKLHPDDTVFDLTERLYGTQIDMLTHSIDLAVRGEWEEVDYSTSSYNHKMTGELERQTLSQVAAYLDKYGTS